MSHCARGDHTAGPREVFSKSELDTDRVGHLAHDAAQRVDFAHQVSLGYAADSGIAGHLRDEINVERVKRGPQPHARRSHSGFATGMAGADYNDVVGFCELQRQENFPE